MHDVLLTIFVVVMIMWLLGGFYVGTDRAPLQRGYDLLAWIAVLILGLVIFAGFGH